MISYSMKSIARSFCRILPKPIQLQVATGYIKLKKRRINAVLTPTTLIFFVTSRCNARCAHCFYWQELNTTRDELALDEIERIASSLRHPIHLSLTGGEPFLRHDLYDICRVFHKKNNCQNIGVATNGFLTDRVVHTCEQILDGIRLDSLSVQVSLDGLEETHNQIRGVKDGYQKVLKTIGKLSQLSKDLPCFSITVSATIQKRNLAEVEELIETLLPFEVPIKFALIRGQNYGTYCLPKDVSNAIDPKDEDSPIVDLEALKSLFGKIKKMNDSSAYHFWSDRQQKKIEVSLEMMRTRKKQLPCYAGKIDGVLYANGDVALCELTKPVGNIRDYEYDFVTVWNSENAGKIRRKIQKCFCIHGCNLTTSMMFDPKIVASTFKRL